MRASLSGRHQETVDGLQEKETDAHPNKEKALIYRSNSPFGEREHEIAQNDLQSGTQSD